MISTRLWPAFILIALPALAGCQMRNSPADTPAGQGMTGQSLTGQAMTGTPSPTAQPATATTLRAPTARLSTAVAGTQFGRMVAQAVRSHPDVEAAGANISIAQADLESSRGALRPAVSIGASAQSRVIGDRDRTNNQATPYLQVSQLIYDGGASASRKAAATANVQQSTNARLVTAANTALDAVDAYLNVISARKILALTQDNLDAHQDMADLIEERRSAGAGSQSDVLTVRSRLADAETLVIDAQSQLERTEARFVQMFGTSPGALETPPVAPALPADTAAAVATSPRISALNAQLAASRSQLRLAEVSRRPQVELDGTAQRADNGGKDITFGLNVEYAFDTRGQSSSAIHRARAEVTRLEAQKAALERDIRRSMDYVKSEAAAGVQRLRSSRAAVEANRANVAAARDEFSIGRRNLLDVLEAQRDYVQAQNTLITSERTQIYTGYDALALTGDIVEIFQADFSNMTPPS
tara:strand:- start:3617 stop:5032 length:1416 start_codon:yes stop_codon:yes gene_type:complete